MKTLVVLWTSGSGHAFRNLGDREGFEPADTKIPAGKAVTLVFNRKTDHTCAKEVVVTTADGKTVKKALPLNTSVEIASTFPNAGKLGYACGMDMLHGTLTVQYVPHLIGEQLLDALQIAADVRLKSGRSWWRNFETDRSMIAGHLIRQSKPR